MSMKGKDYLFRHSLQILLGVYILFTLGSCNSGTDSEKNIMDSVTVSNPDVENGVHVPTGLKDGENLMLVVQTCTACHSAKLISQNRATREGWKNLIVWMQETQKLWPLGENEPKILDYLEANYSPELKSSRRQPLVVDEWYVLE